jgi:ornithine carbamoyltransferase
MLHSLLIGASKLGVDFAAASPEGYEADREVVAIAAENARKSGAKIELVRDPAEAVRGADVIYTDVWASMGFEEEQKEREKAFANYLVNEALAAYAKPDYLFMHCLPAHRGEEVSDGVIDGPNSIIYDQAENRLHAQKAIMAAVM